MAREAAAGARRSAVDPRTLSAALALGRIGIADDSRAASLMDAPIARAHARAVLRQALADSEAEFRPGQWEAIDALVHRNERLLVVQRTGWGKSAVYFVATRLLRDRGRGPTLVISPLLALMRNQIEAAERLRIRAVTINSSNASEWRTLIAQTLGDKVDAILISPERLANQDFVDTVLTSIAGRVGLLVIDEAHCISDWGHDFRPDYRRIVRILQNMPQNMPVVGTTATANHRVIQDVREQLGSIAVQRGPLMRESLALQAIAMPDQAARLAWLVHALRSIEGTGVIYALTRADAEEVSRWLGTHGVRAPAYYSRVEHPDFPDSSTYREHLESALSENRVKALVATSALGMGYDKPDLRFVIHYQAPGGVIAYYQQVGRAGRGIDRAIGVVLHGREDAAIHEYFRRSAFPDERHVNAILDLLQEVGGLTAREIEAKLNLRYSEINQALTYLSVEAPAPVIRIDGRWHRTVIDYRLDRATIARLTRRREDEWREIQEYVHTDDCRMAFLARALDDASVQCGRCDRCLGAPIVPEYVDDVLRAAAARFLRQRDIRLDCKTDVAADAFPIYRFTGRLSDTQRAEQGRILSRWGDSGWGVFVREGKQVGRFSDHLVDAAVELIRTRWEPVPDPHWVTCVPSLVHPQLVPDFAARVAARLNLPFIVAIEKVRANAPQKEQQNRFYQNANLDGVFHITAAPTTPVLLIDDVFDSGWTMTVVAALLRRAGVSRVYPFALAAATTDD